MRLIRRPIFTISVACSLAGIPISTIRRWERAGLISAARRANGWRMFSWQDIETLQRVRRLVRQGHSLPDIRARLRRPVTAPALALPVRRRRRIERQGSIALPWDSARF